MNSALVLNMVLLPLLGAGLFYALRIQRLLAGFGQNRQAMESSITAFNLAIARAENAVKALQEEGKHTSAALEAQVQRGTVLRDELAFLLDAADNISTRITEQMLGAQQEARRHSVANNAVPETVLEKQKPPGEGEKKPAATTPPASTHPAAKQKNSSKSMPAWLKAIAENRQGKQSRPSPEGNAATGLQGSAPLKSEPKSKAERELLEALQQQALRG